MHSSNRLQKIKSLFQKTYMKVIVSIVLFFVFVLAITFGLFFPYSRIYSNDNEFGVVVLGASESAWGINAEVIEEETGEKTCILASLLCDYDGRYELLKGAIEMDSLDLVVLDASNTSLAIKWEMLDQLYFTKINGIGHKLDALKNFSFWNDQYDLVYGEMLNSGLTTWTQILNGTYPEVFERHGYEPQEHAELPFTKEEAGSMHYSMPSDQDYDYTRLEYIRKIVELCREHDTEIIVVTYPVTAMSNWIYTGWDHFHNTMTELTEIIDVPYYDFNLLVDRYDYLPDDICYRDIEHFCAEGADRFSVMLSQLINAHLNDTEVPFQFYDSYEEAQEYSYYRQFMPAAEEPAAEPAA